MKLVYRRCAALDVHKETICACVREVHGKEEVQAERATFGTVTQELKRLGEWLKQHKVKRVAMESTGVYWIPVWNVLEQNWRSSRQHQATLFAVPFEPRRLALAGSPAPILQDVGSTEIGGGDFTFGENGTFVYLNGKVFMGGYPISWVDSRGKMAQPLHAPPGRYETPRFSPDGKRLAYSAGDGRGSSHIWVKDLDRDTTSRLSFMPGVNDYPLWIPDGKTIVFRSILHPANGLYAIRADGSGEAKRLTEITQFPYSFSPDGKRLAVFQRGSGGSYDIFTLPVETDSGPGAPGIRLGKAELFVGTPFDEDRPAFSPDGRSLAYGSVESGKNEVYVRPFSISGEGAGGKWQVSMGGGRVPHWSRDGRELLFLALDNRVMAGGPASPRKAKRSRRGSRGCGRKSASETMHTTTSPRTANGWRRWSSRKRPTSYLPVSRFW